MKIYTKDSLIQELKKIRDMGWIESRRPKNDGAVGNTLEDLLGIEENNLPVPNAAEWELKAQRARTNSLTTLAHIEPSPTALKFVPSILLPIYGWQHKKAGIKYPETELSFRQTIRSGKYSDRGFSVKVERSNGRVSIDFDIDKIDVRHADWRESVVKRGGQILENIPYWGVDDLYHKIGSKLHNCFFVIADSKKEKGIEYFHFNKMRVFI